MFRSLTFEGPCGGAGGVVNQPQLTGAPLPLMTSSSMIMKQQKGVLPIGGMWSRQGAMGGRGQKDCQPAGPSMEDPRTALDWALSRGCRGMRKHVPSPCSYKESLTLFPPRDRVCVRHTDGLGCVLAHRHPWGWRQDRLSHSQGPVQSEHVALCDNDSASQGGGSRALNKHGPAEHGLCCSRGAAPPRAGPAAYPTTPLRCSASQRTPMSPLQALLSVRGQAASAG